MARVTGIGGFFFRALDPDALNQWYGDHLGVVMTESRTYDDPGWFQDRGETVIAACSVDSEMFGQLAKSWMLNFRVDDLDAMVGRLQRRRHRRHAARRGLSQRPLRRAAGSRGKPHPALGAQRGVDRARPRAPRARPGR